MTCSIVFGLTLGLIDPSSQGKSLHELVACILGKCENDPAARIQGVLLISSLLLFQSGRSVSS
jgi:hypothetical protein